MAKSSRLSGEKSHKHPMLRYISLGLMVLGVFFAVLFYVFDSGLSKGDLDHHNSVLYTYALVLTALGIASVILLVYKSPNTFVTMVENSVIIGIIVIAGLTIKGLSEGYVRHFGAANAETGILFTYACLLVGFLGTGALMALLHNLYNRKTIRLGVTI